MRWPGPSPRRPAVRRPGSAGQSPPDRRAPDVEGDRPMAFALTSPAFDADGPIPRRFHLRRRRRVAGAGVVRCARRHPELRADLRRSRCARSDLRALGRLGHPRRLDGSGRRLRQSRRRRGVAHQAINDFGNAGFGGPCPPTGHGTHHYRFRLLALGTPMLDQPAESDCRSVEEAARPHELGRAELVGTYER